MITRATPALAVLLAACGPPELPTSELGDLSLDLFADFDAAPEALPETIARMDELLGELDLDSKPRDRMFQLPQLGPEVHADVSTPAGIDGHDQLALGLAGASRHDLAGNLEAQSQPDQVCINADAVKCHRRDALTDVACFLDGTCEDLRTANVVRIETLPIKVWIEVPVDFRWVELPDGRMAVASRTWMEEEFASDKEKSTWDIRFGVDLFVEDPDDPSRTRRWYASWLGGSAGGISDGWLERVIRGGMDEGFENPDEWLDGEECKIDTSACDYPE